MNQTPLNDKLTRSLVNLKPLKTLAKTQADLSLRWVHSHFLGFVMRRLIFVPYTSRPVHGAWQTLQAQNAASTQGLNCFA